MKQSMLWLATCLCMAACDGSRMEKEAHVHTNRLAQESSPYLLQHARNPVDWYPWGEEAFARARREDRPIFLSIGYSTCHWCHVMERESFEDEKIAAVMNAHFINIKVDREERPDVDKIYMTAAQVMGLGGGWPLSVWLTPELRPYYAGTYFPPESRMGRIGFPDLLLRLAHLWKEDRSKINESAAGVAEHLRALSTMEPNASVLSSQLIERGAAVFKAEYDPKFGGFGGAPKFPRPVTLHFLMRHSVANKDTQAIDMVLHTLRAMAEGGMYDQLGGGFSRYSVDERWLVPHFEKMLYDQAQLVHAYLDGIQSLASNDPQSILFRRIVRETLDYLLRDMLSPEGAFYSAEDADSEGREGAFYVWSPAQIREVLSGKEAEAALLRYGVTEEGNFTDHSAAGVQPSSQNVLSLAMALEDVARCLDVNVAEVDKLLASARHKLFKAREKRQRPHRDDKILTSWNGLMIGAMARAGALLDEPPYLKAATRAALFFKERQFDEKSGKLRHSFREGRVTETGLLDDYAFLCEGLIWLYQSGFDSSWLIWADALADQMIKRFGDAENGGMFMSEAGDASLLTRMKEDYDGAEPSGNSVGIMVLLKLGRMLNQQNHTAFAEKSLKLFGERMARLPQGLPHFLSALDFQRSEHRQVVLVGEGEAFQSLQKAARSGFYPNLLVLSGGKSGATEFLRSLPSEEGTAYYCKGYACELPIRSPEELELKLKYKTW